jgi:hypothetical protein
MQGQPGSAWWITQRASPEDSAEELHRETPMTLRWIATALQMGSWHYLSHLLYQQRRKHKQINKV